MLSRLPDNRLKLIRTEGVGANAARNAAISVARSTWIALLDADDWWRRGRLEHLLDVAEHLAADVVADDVVPVIEDREMPTLFEDRRLDFTADERLLSLEELVRLDLGPLQPVFRRELVSEAAIEFPPHIRRTGDFAFLARLAQNSTRFGLSRRPGYFYSRPGATLSSASPETWLGSIEATSWLMSAEDDLWASKEIRRALERRLVQAYLNYSYMQGDRASSPRRAAAAAASISRDTLGWLLGRTRRKIGRKNGRR
jgi:hypothetical protein